MDDSCVPGPTGHRFIKASIRNQPDGRAYFSMKKIFIPIGLIVGAAGCFQCGIWWEAGHPSWTLSADVWSAIITASATIVIAVYTWQLSRYTTKLWEHGAVTERGYLYFHRIVEKGFHVSQGIWTGDRVMPVPPMITDTLRYSVRNCGKTPIVFTSIWHRVEITANAVPKPIDPREDKEYKIPSGVAIAAGEPFEKLEAEIPNQGGTGWDVAAVNDIDQRRKYFFLVVRIEYNDIFMKPHTLAFCQKYDRDDDTFIVHGNDKLNYLD